MRAILLVFAVFAAGILIGHDFWPRSSPDPTYHLRFHRGKMPPPAAAHPSATSTPAPHGRILHQKPQG